ncbi:hypothetical protein [Pseudomonas moorei]|uniref:hypothetical protein n=1 Tax=Pseudomonas moorei TaxID=395599 RepID=UPI00201095A2|nr:hypothetical protein [Pseudomonas moorei]
MKTPSDLQVLAIIYKLYYEEFKNYSLEQDVQNGRKSKTFVPINCEMIAKELGVDGDIVFGRLYYHMEEKYGYTRDDGKKVAFYTTLAGEEHRCVNFPLLASVLAGLQEENNKFLLATLMSGIALAVSIVVPLAGWLAG